MHDLGYPGHISRIRVLAASGSGREPHKQSPESWDPRGQVTLRVESWRHTLTTGEVRKGRIHRRVVGLQLVHNPLKLLAMGTKPFPQA
jgi:hypothetical protein